MVCLLFILRHSITALIFLQPGTPNLPKMTPKRKQIEISTSSSESSDSEKEKKAKKDKVWLITHFVTNSLLSEAKG